MNEIQVPIFVGSTFIDMQEYRQAVKDGLARLEVVVRGMEHFGARPGNPVEECLRVVGSCRIYIGIFGMRYGTVPEGHEQSMIHLEYHEAQRLKLPSLIYIIDEDKQPVLPKYVETGLGAEKLRGLKEQLKRRHLASFFTTPDDLRARIPLDVLELLNRLNYGISSFLSPLEAPVKAKTSQYVEDPPNVFSLYFTVSPNTGTGESPSTDVPNPFILMRLGTSGGIGQANYEHLTATSAVWIYPDGTIVDIIPSVIQVDSHSLLYAATGLGIGVHALKIKAKCEIGRESISVAPTSLTTYTVTLKVTPRSTYKIKAVPGFNLISIPARPVVTNINDVFGAKTAVKFVMTYDNATGLWLVATRDTSTGKFVGNLTDIDAAHAYWMQSDSVTTLEFSIPRATGGTPTFPNVIKLFKGWNLVPVAADPDANPPGTSIDSKIYFANLDWVAAYTFDAQGTVAIKVTHGIDEFLKSTGVSLSGAHISLAQDRLIVGKGYFVYVNKDGVLIP